MQAYRLLIVEDDINSAKLLARVLQSKGYSVDYVSSAEEALGLLAEVDYDLLLIDLVLPGMNGLDFFKCVKETHSDVPAVIATAYGSITSAVDALKAGASDYVEKPIFPEKLLHILNRIFEARRLKDEVVALRADLFRRYRFSNIIGKHPKLQQIFGIIASLAGMDSAVLITGETGTGKDLVARAIHFESHRKNGPFVAINCASLPETLLESELFGYERGAFTGAHRRKEGKLEQARGGTVFLDEIGDMPLSLQSKLLRTVQEKKIERLGGIRQISLDFRIIAATNKDLTAELASNRFRLDLYYRINVVPVHLPPLRERPEDIPLLADHFLEKLAVKFSRPVPTLSGKALSSLLSHPWPGNVRELENVLECAMVFARGNVIDEIPFGRQSVQSPASDKDQFDKLDSDLPLSLVRDQAVAQIEKQYLARLLKKNKGSIGRTAAQAEIDPRTVLRKMKLYGLSRFDFK